MIYRRAIQESVESALFDGKVVVLYGARQVGKTTLAKNILSNYSGKSTKYISADDPEARRELSPKSAKELKDFIGNYELVVIDEAQRVTDIGLTLKLLVDEHPGMQVIATGSSSFELSNKINEPLTGRNRTFHLEPFSLFEIMNNEDISYDRAVRKMMRVGSYPGIWFKDGENQAQDLSSLTSDYLYKDILEHENIKKAPLLTSLLESLALQLGNEVSFSELSNKLSADIKTIERYIYLLEQTFVIYRLPALARNARNEVGRLRKIYFSDLGLRNSLIRNLNEVDLRNDTGALWENLCINELRNHNAAKGELANYFFWRNYAKQEIDLVLEKGGIYKAFEFKWGKKNAKLPSEFAKLYANNEFKVIRPDNIKDLY